MSQAIFKELRNDEVDDEGNKPEGANLFFGTYIGKDSSEAPDGVRKMLKVSHSPPPGPLHLRFKFSQQSLMLMSVFSVRNRTWP